jgi:hypothetical protein
VHDTQTISGQHACSSDSVEIIEVDVAALLDAEDPRLAYFAVSDLGADCVFFMLFIGFSLTKGGVSGARV